MLRILGHSRSNGSNWCSQSLSPNTWCDQDEAQSISDCENLDWMSPYARFGACAGFVPRERPNGSKQLTTIQSDSKWKSLIFNGLLHNLKCDNGMQETLRSNPPTSAQGLRPRELLGRLLKQTGKMLRDLYDHDRTSSISRHILNHPVAECVS